MKETLTTQKQHLAADAALLERVQQRLQAAAQTYREVRSEQRGASAEIKRTQALLEQLAKRAGSNVEALLRGDVSSTLSGLTDDITRLESQRFGQSGSLASALHALLASGVGAAMNFGTGTNSNRTESSGQATAALSELLKRAVRYL